MIYDHSKTQKLKPHSDGRTSTKLGRRREQRGEGGGSRVEKGGEGQGGWRDVQNEMYQDWSEKPLVLA